MKNFIKAALDSQNSILLNLSEEIIIIDADDF